MPTINNSYGRIETAEMIATAAIVFVRKARAEGYANKLTAETIDGMAQELGILPSRWTWSTAVKIVKAHAKLMNETDLLDLDPKPTTLPKDVSVDEVIATLGVAEKTEAATSSIPAPTAAVNLYAEDGDTVEQADFRRDMAHMSQVSNDCSLSSLLPALAQRWEAMGGMEGAPEEFHALMASARTETRIVAFPAIADRLTALWNGVKANEPDDPQPTATYSAVRSYLGRRGFKLSRMATGRRSGQRWTEGVTVRTAMRGIVVDYRESSGSAFHSDGSHGKAMLAEVRTALAGRWTVKDDYSGGLVVTAAIETPAKTKARTLRRDGCGGYVSSDGRFEVDPAYAPSIRGGSVSRPSYWILTDRTGAMETCDRIDLSDIREIVKTAT